MKRVFGGLMALSLFLSIAGQAQAEYTFSRLDVPGSSFGTVASGINDAGQIVGQYFDVGSRGHGFLLSGGVYTPIDVPGAIAATARGINDAGQIVGDYIDAGFSRSGGFLATPIPEPSTLTLFSIGLLGMLGYARHAGRRADA